MQQQALTTVRRFDARDTFGSSLIAGAPVRSEDIARGIARSAVRAGKVSDGRALVVRIEERGGRVVRERLVATIGR